MRSTAERLVSHPTSCMRNSTAECRTSWVKRLQSVFETTPGRSGHCSRLRETSCSHAASLLLDLLRARARLNRPLRATFRGCPTRKRRGDIAG